MTCISVFADAWEHIPVRYRLGCPLRSMTQFHVPACDDLMPLRIPRNLVRAQSHAGRVYAVHRDLPLATTVCLSRVAKTAGAEPGPRFSFPVEYSARLLQRSGLRNRIEGSGFGIHLQHSADSQNPSSCQVMVMPLPAAWVCSGGLTSGEGSAVTFARKSRSQPDLPEDLPEGRCTRRQALVPWLLQPPIFERHDHALDPAAASGVSEIIALRGLSVPAVRLSWPQAALMAMPLFHTLSRNALRAFKSLTKRADSTGLRRRDPCSVST